MILLAVINLNWGRRIWPTIIGFLICILVISCDNDGDKRKYGVDFDGERAKRSIPPVGTNTSTMSDWGTAWVYDHVEKGRSAKSAQTKDGQIQSEYDTYYSGTKYPRPDGSAELEYLQITYSFEAERHTNNPWSAVYYGSNRQDKVSFEDAERLLAKWGVQRIEGKAK